jgi:hypothetical protein
VDDTWTALIVALGIGAAGGMLWVALDSIRLRMRAKRIKRLKKIHGPQPGGMVRGERPEVRLTVDGVFYDLTESGQRVADSSRGNTVWEYPVPGRLLAEAKTPPVIECPVLPPRTELRLVSDGHAGPGRWAIPPQSKEEQP